MNADPTYNLHVVGNAYISSTLTAGSYASSSDQRIKKDVVDADPDECLRIIQTVTPKTYKRIDLEDVPERCGYIAQHFDRELTGGFRCIMGQTHDEHGDTLLAIDYARVVPVLHGALLSALARIEALESKVM